MINIRNQNFGILVCLVALFRHNECLYVEDFRGLDVTNWKEISDSLYYSDGQSISSLVTPQKEGRSAVLFTLLVPCEHNASFAGIVKEVSLDISEESNLVLKIANYGEYSGYEFLLRHNGDLGDLVPSYVTYFKAQKHQFEVIKMPINEFKAIRQGQPVDDHIPLNKRNITSLGILAYGGAHKTEKQRGVAALEIEWIRIE